MAFRTLTAQFVSHRPVRAGPPLERPPLEETPITLFLERCVVLRCGIQKQISVLHAAYDAAGRVSFSADQVQRQKQGIQLNEHRIKQMFQMIDQETRRFAQLNTTAWSANEREIHKNVLTFVNHHCQALLASFQQHRHHHTHQVVYEEEEKERHQQEVEVKESDVMSETEPQRHKDIDHLVSDIEDLLQLTHQMDQMVKGQGETVDNIERHLDVALEHVQDGNKELKSAENHSRFSALTCCFIVLVICIILFVTIIIVKET